MAKRRRQDSLRISVLAKNSSNGIGLFLVHSPPGERKSGIPHSVEIPAPVKGAMVRAPSTSLCSSSMAVSRSDAIMRAVLSIFGQVMSGGHTMRYLHTMLRVRNLDSALDFYCNKL